MNLGHLRIFAGDFEGAIRLYAAAAESASGIVDEATRMGLIANIDESRCMALTELGRYPEAIEAARRALAHHEVTQDRLARAHALGNLANLEQRIGDFDRAITHQRETVALWKVLDEADGEGLAAATGQLGAMLSVPSTHTRDPAREVEAEALLRVALDLYRKRSDERGVATAQLNLGFLLARTGKPDEALALVGDLPAFWAAQEDPQNQSAANACIAVARTERHEYEPALASYGKALEQARAAGDTNRAIQVVEGMARAELGRGDFAAAVARAREAQESVQALVGALAERTSAFARQHRQWIYQIGAFAALESEDVAAVVHFLESSRAASLLVALASGAADERALPVELVAESRRLRGEESTASAALGAAVEAGKLRAVRAAREKLAAIRDRLVVVEEQLRMAAKAATTVALPRAASPETIQGALGADEALVLYADLAGDLPEVKPVTVAVVFRPDAVRVVRLGASADIVRACENAVFDDGGIDPAAAVTGLRKRLIEPLGLTDAVRHVRISPDGATARVPFCLLFDGLDVSFAPSGTVHTAIRARAARKGSRVLAVGDPAYRSVSGTAKVGSTRGGGETLPRLPFTRAEIDAISAEGDVVLLGEQATEDGLLAHLAKDVHWSSIHLACHGLLDQQEPVLSGLALTPSAQHDGLLTALQVFGLPIRADLVVLSACDTGRGRTFKGDGLLGLNTAFLVAGAPRVLVSLWKADDAATRTLMASFYEGWRVERLPAATALRRAQDSVRSQARWKHPRYWAGWALWGGTE